MRWNAYAMDFGRGIIESVGFLLIGTVKENDKLDESQQAEN